MLPTKEAVERTQGLSVGRETNSSLAGKWILPEAQVRGCGEFSVEDRMEGMVDS